jgi:hypothetical protein
MNQHLLNSIVVIALLVGQRAAALAQSDDDPPMTTESMEAAAPEPRPEVSTSPAHSSASMKNEAPRVAANSEKAHLLPLALGVEIGEGSGVSVGYLIRDRHEINGLVGYSMVLQSLVTRVDYAFHFWDWTPAPDYGVELAFYGGAGLRLGLFEPRPIFLREPKFALGARVPVGVVATLPPFPAELAINIAPGFDAIPEWRFHMEGGLSLRFRVDAPTLAF